MSGRRGRRRAGAARRAGSLLALGLLVATGACSRNDPPAVRTGERRIDPRLGTSPSPRVAAEGQRIPKGGGIYKVGVPYRVAGRWYTPRVEPGYDRSGIASWYGDDFHGRKTANGEIYDMNALSAAHPTLPLPSYVWVTSERTGRTILVRVNDRGPYAHDRVIDLSRASARALGIAGLGISTVRVRWAGNAPLNGDDRREVAFLRSQPWYAAGPLAASGGTASGPAAGAWRPSWRPAATTGRVGALGGPTGDVPPSAAP